MSDANLESHKTVYKKEKYVTKFKFIVITVNFIHRSHQPTINTAYIYFFKNLDWRKTLKWVKLNKLRKGKRYFAYIYNKIIDKHSLNICIYICISIFLYLPTYISVYLYICIHSACLFLFVCSFIYLFILDIQGDKNELKKVHKYVKIFLIS